MTKLTICHDCKRTIRNPRFTLHTMGRQLALCEDCMAARLTTPKPAPAKDDAKPASAWMSVGEA